MTGTIYYAVYSPWDPKEPCAVVTNFSLSALDMYAQEWGNDLRTEEINEKEFQTLRKRFEEARKLEEII